VSVYIATDPAKRYGFVEFGDVGITLAIGALDNLQVDFGGGGNLRIRRPNDYKPDLAQRDGLVVDTSAWIGSVKGCRFDLNDCNATANASVGESGNPVGGMTPNGGGGGMGGINGVHRGTSINQRVDDGPNKIFLGGLPYTLSKTEVIELLQAFGPLKAFHLAVDPAAPAEQNSKGYGFCEYVDPANTNLACEGLNGMELGEKPLTVRVANPRNEREMAVMGMAANPYAPPPMPQQVSSGMEVDALLNMAIGGGMAPPMQMQMQVQVQMHVPPPAPAATSKALKLSNMVTQEDLDDSEEYEDLLEDIKEECAKFGTDVSVVIPRKGEFAMGVYLLYGDVGGSGRAKGVLHNRPFGDSKCVCEEISEDLFGEICVSAMI